VFFTLVALSALMPVLLRLIRPAPAYHTPSMVSPHEVPWALNVCVGCKPVAEHFESLTW